MQATMSAQTSILGVELASDKEGTKRILADAGVPVPKGTIIYLDELEEAIRSSRRLSYRDQACGW